MRVKLRYALENLDPESSPHPGSPLPYVDAPLDISRKIALIAFMQPMAADMDDDARVSAEVVICLGEPPQLRD
jgi:hypothetical protein